MTTAITIHFHCKIQTLKPINVARNKWENLFYVAFHQKTCLARVRTHATRYEACVVNIGIGRFTYFHTFAFGVSLKAVLICRYCLFRLNIFTVVRLHTKCTVIRLKTIKRNFSLEQSRHFLCCHQNQRDFLCHQFNYYADRILFSIKTHWRLAIPLNVARIEVTCTNRQTFIILRILLSHHNP